MLGNKDKNDLVLVWKSIEDTILYLEVQPLEAPKDAIAYFAVTVFKSYDHGRHSKL